VRSVGRALSWPNISPTFIAEELGEAYGDSLARVHRRSRRVRAAALRHHLAMHATALVEGSGGEQRDCGSL
jgi:hypothetical protein